MCCTSRVEYSHQHQHLELEHTHAHEPALKLIFNHPCSALEVFRLITPNWRARNTTAQLQHFWGHSLFSLLSGAHFLHFSHVVWVGWLAWCSTTTGCTCRRCIFGSAGFAHRRCRYGVVTRGGFCSASSWEEFRVFASFAPVQSRKGQQGEPYFSCPSNIPCNFSPNPYWPLESPLSGTCSATSALLNSLLLTVFALRHFRAATFGTTSETTFRDTVPHNHTHTTMQLDFDDSTQFLPFLERFFLLLTFQNHFFHFFPREGQNSSPSSHHGL